jgi:hypothetical protein
VTVHWFRRPPVRLVRRQELYASCVRKAARYSSELVAEVEALAARRRYGSLVHAYRCPYCREWHIGSPGRLRRFIENGQRSRPDVWMAQVLGERAYYCGAQESTGLPANRERVVVNRAARAVKRAGGLRSGRPPPATPNSSLPGRPALLAAQPTSSQVHPSGTVRVTGSGSRQ